MFASNGPDGWQPCHLAAQGLAMIGGALELCGLTVQITLGKFFRCPSPGHDDARSSQPAYL
jgi:hypothetical protein